MQRKPALEWLPRIWDVEVAEPLVRCRNEICVVANVLVTLVGAIPAIAAYLSAKHYFDFEQQSFKQIAAFGVGFLCLMGPILLQPAILTVLVFRSESEYLRKLTLVQFVAALIAYIWKLRKTHAAQQSRVT